MKILKHGAYFVAGALIWLITFLGVHFLAKDTIRFLALHITHSQAKNIGCCKFEWDIKLQIVAYSLYATVFFLVSWVLLIIQKKFSDSTFANRVLIFVFIMVFPAHTFWGVATDCRGFGGCANGYYFNIVVPAIMSTNPVAIIVSAIVAYQIAKIYIRRSS